MSLVNRLLNMVINPIYYFYIIGNRVKFKFYNIKYGKNLKVFNRIYVRKKRGAKIIIGDNLIFSSGNGYNALSRNICGSIFLSDNKSQIVIGNNVGLSSCVLRCSESITIGNHVNIGADTIILDTDAHCLNYKIRRDRKTDVKFAKSAPIVIEDDVLIGTRCIILKGVTIGARSVIGAGSIVTKSIPANCIATGNPCKVIKKMENENNAF